MIEKFRYKVDLRGYMADCDANYLRLIKLFPEYQSVSSRTFTLAGCVDRVLEVTVLEHTPYTSLLMLRQRDRCQIEWLQLPALRVRLYHDAKVAEVVSFEDCRRPYPRYAYPNSQMHQQDEKAQWSRFLAELLAQSLAHGYDNVTCYEPASG